MKQFLKIFAVSVSLLMVGAGISGCSSKEEQPATSRPSTKRERNYMKEGKSLFDKQRYAEAEVNFKKALGENPDNARAQFNLASSYLKQRGEDLSNKGDSLIRQADQIFAQTAGNPDVELAELSFYDRGNIAYKGEDYAAAIEMYKNALRRNPENNQARENLRLAQLKKQEQDQNKDNQQNKDDQQNQDQNQDQQQQQQNQDQQDKNDQQDKDKQQDQQQQQQDQKQQQQQQGGLSEQSAAQILKAMDDKESATRMKVEQMKQDKEKQSRQRQTGKPW
jgi:Ca-activated chloride channel family protein